MVPERPTPGEAIKVDYLAGNAIIRNTGHDILVTPTGDAGKITIGSKVYNLLQFHFHFPSEHHINGSVAPAEMHIVHGLEGGGPDDYAVIGVMLTSSTTPTYQVVEPVFANLPEKVCDKSDPMWIEFDKLLPRNVSIYYTYAGSLTTPPCTQSAIWYVLGERRTISVSEMRKLSALGENARPIQRKMNVTFVHSQ